MHMNNSWDYVFELRATWVLMTDSSFRVHPEIHGQTEMVIRGQSNCPTKYYPPRDHVYIHYASIVSFFSKDFLLPGCRARIFTLHC